MLQVVSLIFILTAYVLCKPCIACTTSLGSLTPDRTVAIGSPLEITCTLNQDFITVNNYSVNASYLTIKWTNNTHSIPVDDKNVHIISPLASSWRINSATEEDTGIYACSVYAGNKNRLVCQTVVNVGSKPQKSSIDFRCTSNYKVLECRWETEPSKMKVKSVLKDISRLTFNDRITSKTPCPNMIQENNTWLCRWTRSVNPPFNFRRRKFEFVVETSNIFGTKSDTYLINHTEIVLPGKPEKLNVLSRTPNMIELDWLKPALMDDFPGDLLYQVTLVPQSQLKLKVINVSQSSAKISYKVAGLVPSTVYDIVVRCRSPYAKGEDMWSANVTIRDQTMPDVPYLAPDTTKEAFEVIRFQNFRTIIVQWKKVPKEYWNGENFHYKISLDEIHSKKVKNVFSDETLSSNATSFSVSGLALNSTYHFKIFSANNHGSSRNHSSIIVDSDEKLLDVPENITVISYSYKEFNISWKPPSSDPTSIKSYMLFWCDKPHPYTDHCLGSVHWKHVTGTNAFVSTTDDGRHFQFAVAANSEDSTSGLAWAPCVVSHRDKPSKPDIKFCYETPTSLQANLKLKCAVEVLLVKEIYVFYCKVPSEHNNCGGTEIKKKLPNGAVSYNIMNLTPFTLYGAYFRVIAKNGESIDSDIQYQRTLSAAPSDPPSDVKALSVTNSSIKISWKPPKQPNGIIASYLLEYNDILHTINNTTSNIAMLTKKIMPFTNYTILLKACVDGKCSPPSEPLHVLTDVGIPGEMREPQVEVNASWANIWWGPPSNPNGPIDYYILYVERIEGYNESYNQIINITGDATSTAVSFVCPAIEKGIRYSFQLQPVNILGNEHLLGRKTYPASRVMCRLSPDEGLSLEMIVGVVVGSAVGCAILLIVSYMFIRWMKKKYDLLKTIKVRLPKGLDTPNKLAPGTYQEFEKELLQHCPYPVQRQGSFSSESIKNRHGSGNSQYSNYSTDELLMRRSNHCGIYCRNPSGDSSSGCSSTGGHDSIVSCHTIQTHISADSGAEIDLSPVSVKDNVFLEEKSLQEPAIFIMPDVRDKSSNDSELMSEKEHELEKNDKVEAYSSIGRNVPPLYSAYIQPYSKFGVNQIKDGRIQNCSRQYSILPYVRNLANSEPSVAELDFGNADEYGSSFIPYSKLTFAKSLENISGNNVGYSKCGMVDEDGICDVPNAVKLTHLNANKHQNYMKIGDTDFTSFKPCYVGIRKCLEEGSNRPKPQMPSLTENIGATMSDNAIDSMAYSKFDINPSGLLSVASRINTKSTPYIPLQKAMLQAMNVPCNPLNDATDKELSHSNISLPAELVISAIIDPSIKQCPINGSSYVPLNQHNNVYFCTNHVGNQDITPVSLSCDRTDEKLTMSLSDINLNLDNCPEETYNSKKLSTNENQTSADEQTPLKSNYLRESEVVVSPGSLNYSSASVPEYRFHGQSDQVDPANSKSGYIHFSPVYYV